MGLAEEIRAAVGSLTAFGRSDANGHYVLVYSCGDCFTDGPLAQQSQAGAAAGQAGASQPNPRGQSGFNTGRSDIPDERLIALMVGTT